MDEVFSGRLIFVCRRPFYFFPPFVLSLALLYRATNQRGARIGIQVKMVVAASWNEPWRKHLSSVRFSFFSPSLCLFSLPLLVETHAGWMERERKKVNDARAARFQGLSLRGRRRSPNRIKFI
jgi:hypothetical protein